MKKALASIRQLQNSFPIKEAEIKPTHYYLKFYPQNAVEFEKLMDFDKLYFYTFPLDAPQPEIVPEFSSKNLIPLYTSAPISLDVTQLGVRYEKLEDLYIPDDFDTQQFLSKSQNNLTADIITLVNESMKLTGNSADTVRTNVMIMAYVPSGRVQVMDTRMNAYIPLRGVRMEARRWFTTHHGYTDANGYYSVNGDFDRDCNYSLIFECGDYDVRTGTFGQAKIDGPKQSSPWNVNINGGENQFYAHVFRGAQRYWRGDIADLARPINAPGIKTKYAAYYGKNKEYYTIPVVNNGTYPNISVYSNRSNGIALMSDEIFSGTVHETAHWSHLLNYGTPNFSSAGDFVRESWAVGVEWFLTQMEYKEKGISNYAEFNYDVNAIYPINFGHQNWLRDNAFYYNDYSSLVIDLFDNYNQLGNYFSNGVPSTIDDQVTGFSFGTFEQIIKYTTGKANFFDRIKQYKPSNVTDAQLDVLFSSF